MNGSKVRIGPRSGTLLDEVPRASLVDSAGTSYREFRRTLTPHYGVVWSHLALGYLALAATLWVVARADDGWPAVPAIVLGGVAVGYIVAFVQLFFHEAAHFNIAPSRRLNDLLANALIGSLVGQDVRQYRPIHFGHHRHLGTTEDTERTYFDPLNVRFLVEALLGVKTVKVLAHRDQVLGDANAAGGGRGLLALAAGVALNLAVVGGAASLGWFAVAGAWLVGMLGVYPFLAALRQLLEHRDEGADSRTDYRVVPHGPVTRMFHGALAPTLGGAGFSRHALHHWDPQVSYTRLGDLERFLRDTDAAPALSSCESTYSETFRRLFAR